MPVLKQENCVIDTRVSDPQQLQGGSLEDQAAQGHRLAVSRGWNVLRVFSKPHSATTTERDDFEEVIDYISSLLKTGDRVHYYVVKRIDRMTRAGYPEYEKMKNRLEDLGVQIADVEGLIQPKKNTLEHLGDFKYKWSVYAPSESAEMLAAYGGKQEARDILTRLIGAEIRLVQGGYKVREANDGFVNRKIVIGGQRRVIETPDPERAHFFIAMFELRAAGLDDKQIVERVNAMGFTTPFRNKWATKKARIIGRTGGNLLTVKSLQAYIKRTIYAGVKCEKWTSDKPIRAQYEGLISIATFNRANKGKVFIEERTDGALQLRHNYVPSQKQRRLKDNPEYPFKNILCDLCSKPYLGSASRGKGGKQHPAYHCGGASKGARAHTYTRTAKAVLEADVARFVQALRFDPAFIQSFEMVVNDVYRTREKEVVTQSSAISQNVADLKAEQAAILGKIISTNSKVVHKQLEDKMEDLEVRIVQAQEVRDEIEIQERDVKGFIKYTKYVMEHPSEVLIHNDDLVAQRTLFGLVFEEPPTYQQIRNGTPKLSLAFKLSDDWTASQSTVVHPCGIEPQSQPSEGYILSVELWVQSANNTPIIAIYRPHVY